MTDEKPATPDVDLSDIPNKPKRCTPTFAYQVWQKASRPGFRVLAKILTDKGYAVSFKTLQRWKEDDVKWLKEWMEHQEADVEAAINYMQLAVRDSDRWQDRSLLGIQVQLFERLWISVKAMTFNNIDEVHKGLDAADRISQLAHAMRGRTIAEESKTALPTVAEPAAPAGSVVTAFRNTLPIKPFANGKGA